MSDTVIKVEDISKLYRLGEVGTGTISHDLNRWWHKVRGKEDPYLKIGQTNDRTKKGDSDYAWALKDVSFEVKRGEVLGIIGRNGAGKSTLLKILSRVTTPTSGQVKVKGRIASLLEVGTGFNPELTGRDNIYLNGAILGMRKQEIDRKFDEIVDFAEVERYIDTPVKRYSSGMYVRLAFAVAAHLEPEILIVDEVLAVGDAEFQKKCMGKMKDVAGHGRTILFVSHNQGAVESLCNRVILMQKGALVFDGEPRPAIAKYLAAFERTGQPDLEHETDRSGNGLMRLRKVRLLLDGKQTTETTSGATVHFEFAYMNPQGVKSAHLTFTIYNENGIAITNIQSSMMGGKMTLQPDSGIVTCCLPRLALNQGNYRLAVAIQDESGENYDHISSALWFKVAGSKFYATGKSPEPRYSLILTDHSWC